MRPAREKEESAARVAARASASRLLKLKAEAEMEPVLVQELGRSSGTPAGDQFGQGLAPYTLAVGGGALEVKGQLRPAAVRWPSQRNRPCTC